MGPKWRRGPCNRCKWRRRRRRWRVRGRAEGANHKPDYSIFTHCTHWCTHWCTHCTHCLDQRTPITASGDPPQEWRAPTHSSPQGLLAQGVLGRKGRLGQLGQLGHPAQRQRMRAAQPVGFGSGRRPGQGVRVQGAGVVHPGAPEHRRAWAQGPAQHRGNWRRIEERGGEGRKENGSQHCGSGQASVGD